MNSVASELAAEPLLFSWDSPRRRRAMLAAFLVLSLMAHALCFYVFQIVYSTPVALLPPPARVTFIAPDSEEGRTLLRWIDAEDPAVAFTTHPAPGVRLGALPRTEHLPSYSTVKPILKELPPLQPDLRVPSSRPPGAVHSIARKTASARGTARTYISFSKELDQFGAPTVLKFATAFQSTHQVIQRWTNKRACRSSVAVSHKTDKPAPNPALLSFGVWPQFNGAATSHPRSKHRQLPSRRDSRQSCYSSHHLSAAFSCGGVSILDSGRMEPPAARATVSSAPVALCDLRVRI